MTAGDGDAEHLRVPRWITPPSSSEGEPGYGSDDPGPAVRHGRDPDDDEDDPHIYVPRRYSREAGDDDYEYDPDLEDELDAISPIDDEYPGRRAAWKDTL